MNSNIEAELRQEIANRNRQIYELNRRILAADRRFQILQEKFDSLRREIRRNMSIFATDLRMNGGRS